MRSLCVFILIGLGPLGAQAEVYDYIGPGDMSASCGESVLKVMVTTPVLKNQFSSQDPYMRLSWGNNERTIVVFDTGRVLGQVSVDVHPSGFCIAREVVGWNPTP